jgi:hypothetical protein
MKRLLALILATFGLGAFAADADTAPAAAKPRVFALVGAMGDVFMSTDEVVRTGSHLPPWRRTAIDAKDNVLDKLVLAGLDQAVAKMEPASKRIYFAVNPPRVATNSTPMDEVGRDAALAYLKDVPDRDTWDRIVIATPGFRVQAEDAMPGRTQGFGVFMQPLCQSLSGACGMSSIGQLGDGLSAGGETVKTPDGRTIQANQFVAPYVYLKIWIVDPKTLAVIDSQEVFEYQKMWNPDSDSLDMSQMIPKRVMATQIVELASQATQDAVKRSELRGQVDVKEHGPVKPTR